MSSIVLSTLLRIVLGFFTAASLMMLINLGFFVLWVYMLISAYQGKTIVLSTHNLDVAQRLPRAYDLVIHGC